MKSKSRWLVFLFVLVLCLSTCFFVPNAFAEGRNAHQAVAPVSGLAYVKSAESDGLLADPKKLNIFESTDKFAFEIHLKSAIATGEYLKWKIEDYFRNTVHAGTAYIPARQKMVTVSPGSMQTGHYVVTASVREGEEGEEKVFDNFAVVLSSGQRSNLSDSPFGINTFYAWYDRANAYPDKAEQARHQYLTTDKTYSFLDNYAKALKLSGITWVRDVTLWKSMAATKRNYFDRYVNRYKNNGLNVLEMFLGTPDDAKNPESINLPNEKPITGLPDNLTKAYEAGKRFGKYFDSRVDMWEILNEPEGGPGGTTVRDSADRYAAFLKAMSIGFYESGVPVTMGGLITRVSSDYRDQRLRNNVAAYAMYQDNLFKNGIIDYVEVYNFHNHQRNVDPAQETPLTRAYYNPVLNHNVFSVGKNLAHIEKQKSLPGGSSLPTWNTEAGGAIANSPHGLDDSYDKQKAQARFWVTSAVMSLSTGVDKHFWFSGRQVVENQPPYKNVYWGFFSPYNPSTDRITPYAAYVAQAALTEALGEAIYLGKVNNLLAGAECHVFKNGADTVLVLWAEQTQSVPLPLQQQDATLTDIVGRKKTVSSVNGVLSLPISPDPVYLNIGNGTVPYTASNFTRKTPVLKTLTPAQKIVLDQVFPVSTRANASGDTRVNARGEGYLIHPGNTQTKVKVKIYNFNDIAVTGTVTGSFGGAVGYAVSDPQEVQPIRIEPKQSATLAYTITTPGTPGVSVYLSFTGNFNVGEATPSVSRVKVRAFPFP